MILTIQHAAQVLLAGWKGKRVGSEGTARLNRALVRLLGSCQRHDYAPPKELVDLVARQLKVAAKPRNETHSKRKRATAIKASARDSAISSKKLARACGVSLPTISRWKKDPSFSQEVEHLKANSHSMGPPNKRRKFGKWTIEYDADGHAWKCWADGVDPDRDFPFRADLIRPARR